MFGLILADESVFVGQRHVDGVTVAVEDATEGVLDIVADYLSERFALGTDVMGELEVCARKVIRLREGSQGLQAVQVADFVRMFGRAVGSFAPGVGLVYRDSEVEAGMS